VFRLQHGSKLNTTERSGRRINCSGVCACVRVCVRARRVYSHDRATDGIAAVYLLDVRQRFAEQYLSAAAAAAAAAAANSPAPAVPSVRALGLGILLNKDWFGSS
jgi:hypothetical protein